MIPSISRAVCLTIGIPSVNNLFLLYQILTLIFMLLFAVYDQKHHVIRNDALALFLLWCFLSIPIEIMCSNISSWYQPLLKSGLGFIAGFSILFCVALVSHGGVGGGDIKLVAVLGIPYGAFGLLCILFIASVMATIISSILSRMNKLDTEHIPFAPYLFLGSLFYTLLSI